MMGSDQRKKGGASLYLRAPIKEFQNSEFQRIPGQIPGTAYLFPTIQMNRVKPVIWDSTVCNNYALSHGLKSLFIALT